MGSQRKLDSHWIYHGTSQPVLARVKNTAGTAITKATVSKIEAEVRDKSDSDNTTYSAELTVNDVVFDTLQTDAERWTDPSGEGYNFEATLPASAFPNAERTYEALFTFTMTDGTVLKEAQRFYTRPLLSG